MKDLEVFKGKSILITGGTGSFGNTVLSRFLGSDIEEIRVFSRDEKKQDDMRRHYQSEKLRFFLGDVRDRSATDKVTRGIDYIFHAAALKQVPSCDFFPIEAVKTNVLGTENVLESAIENRVSRVVCLSTDKAVYPINAMGISKAMMEKVVVSKSRFPENSNTVIVGTRYGNVMASRGSVIPLFIRQIISGSPITITDPLMTRFMMSLDDAVDLVVFAFKNGECGDIFVQKAPSATIEVLVEALKVLFGSPNHSVELIGTRHGEKRHEVLLSREEMSVAEDLGDYFRVPADDRGLNYGSYLEVGDDRITQSLDYNSESTKILNVNETIRLLEKVPYVRAALDGRDLNLELT